MPISRPARLACQVIRFRLRNNASSHGRQHRIGSIRGPAKARGRCLRIHNVLAPIYSAEMCIPSTAPNMRTNRGPPRPVELNGTRKIAAAPSNYCFCRESRNLRRSERAMAGNPFDVRALATEKLRKAQRMQNAATSTGQRKPKLT